MRKVVKKKMASQIGLYVGDELQRSVREKCTSEDRKISEVVRGLLRLWVKGRIEIL